MIFALGILTLLSLLAISLVEITRLERQATANYVLGVRAHMLALAGVEHATSALRDYAREQAYDSPKAPWVFRNDADDDFGYGIDLADAKNPSFHRALPSGVVVSGALGGTFVEDGDYYKLKVVDCASQLNLNGPQASLVRMLQVLGRQIQAERGENPIPDAAAAQAILDFRAKLPLARFQSKDEVEAIPSIGPKRFRFLKDYVSVHGWRDEQTLKPNPPQPVLDPKVPRRPALELEARYPVDVNTASKPVLTATLAFLKGWAWEPRVDSSGLVKRDNTRVSKLDLVEVPEIPEAAAAALADKLIARRKVEPFKTWAELEQFVLNDGVAPGPGALTADQAALVVANANPNARVSLWNPDEPSFARVEKLNLSYATTELCFSSMGFFEITSLGRVIGKSGRAEAEQSLVRIAQVFQVFRHTSQRDFDLAREAFPGYSPPASGDPEPGFSATVPEPVRVLRGNDSFARKPSAYAAAYDGAFRLTTEWPAIRASSQTLFTPFRDRMSAEVAAAPNPIGAKRGDLPLARGGDLTPDGVLCWRQAPPGDQARDLAFDAKGNVSVETGAIEMWVKLATDPALGSDEPVCYTIVRHPSPPAPSQGTRVDMAGTAWRLERYGTRLYSTRFFFGSPDPSPCPYRLVWSEHWVDVSAWKAREWHHIAHSWFEGVDQRFYVDGRPSPNILTLATRSTGGSGTPTGPTRRFRLGSIDPSERAWMGGYRFTNPRQQDIYRTGRFEQGLIERFVNATLDDLRVYSSQRADLFPPAGFVPPDRYSTDSDNAKFAGAFEMGRDAGQKGYAVGTIAWTARMPTRWGRITVNPADLQLDIRRGSNPASLQPIVTGSPLDGRGYKVATAPDRDGKFYYEFRFSNPGRLTPLAVSPVVDDVTITLIGPVQVMEMVVER